MMPLSSIVGLAACSLVAVAIVLSVFKIRRRSRHARFLCAFGLLSLMFVPIGGIPIGGYVRGLIGDPSVTMVVIAALAFVAQAFARDVLPDHQFRFGMILIVAAAAFLYPATLGLSAFDPYALGYGSPILWAAVLAITIVAWYLDQYLVLLCTTLGVLVFLLGLSESPNLWDHLLDPVAVITAVAWLIEDRNKAMAARRRDPAPLAVGTSRS